MGLITHGAVLQNEVKGWPPLVQIGAGFDLVTQNQWFDDVATPTTKASAVPVSGEAGLTAKFTDVIKCVTDAANEGFMQRFTYAAEPRIKLGVTLSALIWVGSTAGGVDCTVKLLNSDATETAGVLVATDGDWDLYLVEAHVCAGTFVDLQVTKDTAGTFYAGGDITVILGANAVELRPRQLRMRWRDAVSVKDLTGLADEATWTDIDLTSVTSALAAMAFIAGRIADNTASDDFGLFSRRNGSSEAPDLSLNAIGRAGGTEIHEVIHGSLILLDDAQIFEYYLDRIAGSGTLQAGAISLRGWWEWE